VNQGEFKSSILLIKKISSMEERMGKTKWYLLFVWFIFASLVIAACGGQAKSGTGPLQKIGKGEGAVSIISWAGYVERGETDRIWRMLYELGSGEPG